LEKSGTSIKIKIRFDYSGIEVDYFSNNKEIVVIEKDIICDISRDFEEEERIVELLNEFSVVTHEEKDEFIIDTDLVSFVSEKLPEIAKQGIGILGEENLFNFKISKAKGKMDIGISQKNDWFEIKGKAKFGVNEVDIQKVVEAIFQNKRFIELSDDKKAIIPKSWVNSLKNYSGFFDFSENLRLSKNHLSIVDSFSFLSANVKMDPYVKKALATFEGFEKIKPTKLPKELNAKLRPYQKVGYDWLSFLRDYNFNGVLADDMGLGKTLQTIALLQKLKENKTELRNSGGHFLVIVPTSLAFNWKNELKKFVPSMKVYLHHGQKRYSGEKFHREMKKHDLIITTYGVLRNDLKEFSKIDFEYIVLDEAHVIKNPMSIAAKSVCQLKGRSKLVISGTPIQNNLTELWSLFNFLNPGYLGGYEFFRENFVVPIERDHDKNAAGSLRKLINPFLLRRTKKVISNELPPKTELVLTNNLTGEEKEVYDNWKSYYKYEIQNSIQEKGLNKSKMKILEGLTKLRQICLHPKMIDTRYTGNSSKFELLMMELEKVISEGHKVLVFSSFVKLLGIAREELEKKGIKYSYLDGKTKNREKIVSNFQDSDEAQVFLISIKAGGLGLNLTSADYVFIVDPWWNPAVEMQAMDRAHRIGQDKKVFVYKMIANGTIEDKILELQKSKRKLVEDLIVEEKSLVKDIDMAEIKKIFG
jgi:non-specific serine/threonine protein kinase